MKILRLHYLGRFLRLKLNIFPLKIASKAMSGDCDKIIVHLIEGFRTVIVDQTVKFRSVIDSITERLSRQYAEKHNAPTGDNKYGWIFGIRFKLKIFYKKDIKIE